MVTPKTADQLLAELCNPATMRLRRAPRIPDAAPLIARLLAHCKTLAVEERAGGIAFRLQGTTETAAAFSIICVLHHPAGARALTTAEQAVAEQLCEGRTLAQIAHLRGVSTNTVKSQVRQIFRKLNVYSRVALVRALCP
ncbi:MAG TPA: helix-turn-helix transcriptional regulator [Steroidobacteraceae bacterium]|jgi:DNA-binding NarL/FixJ family response regulator|nr:helix-turn-helix transcriptional regulator [Steroidobacteraceae bacterium]